MFENNNAHVYGGAVYINGANTHITGSNFTQAFLTSTNSAGGAIYIAGDNAIVNNSNVDGSYADRYGGAVYVAGSKTTIMGSKFTNNYLSSTSGALAGAIYVAGNNTNISYSTLINNHASGSGGGIYVTGINTTVSFSNLSQNYASTAGAVYMVGTNSSISHSKLTENHATVGGAMYVEGLNAKVAYTIFRGNYAANGGGSIYWIGGYSGNEIIGSEFYDSRCTSNFGGAIYWTQGATMTSSAAIRDCKFINNYASSHGGAIDWYKSDNSIIDNTIFINNTCNGDGADIYAGATGARGKNLTISNCKFINSTANHCGGSIALQMSNSRITNCTFDKTLASYGGAIVMKDGHDDARGTVVSYCNFSNTVADGHDPDRLNGGAIHIANSNIQILYCNFNNSRSLKGQGGAISYIGSNPVIINATISNCAAQGVNSLGGAIYCKQTANLINITCYNDVSYKGGAIYLCGQNSRLSNINIDSCSARLDGGAIYFETTSQHQNDVIDNIHISNCKAVNMGGGIYLGTPNTKFTNVYLINNSANRGGGVYVYERSNNKFTNVVADGCKAVYNTDIAGEVNAYGGAFYWLGGSGSLTNATISNCHSDNYGGAIYLNALGFNVIDANFTNNDAGTDELQGCGGAIYASSNGLSSPEKNPMKITSSSFTSNRANNDGGAIYSAYGGAQITSCNFTRNIAGENGGAIVIASGSQTILSSNFEANNATKYGGSVYVSDGIAGILIKDSTFKKSYAYNGGAIYNSGSSDASLTIYNDTFIKNIASHNGGAVFYIAGQGTINNVTYRDYKNFDNQGVINNAGRTTLKMTVGPNNYDNVIYNSLFEHNQDYILNITSKASTFGPMATVTILNPKGDDTDKNSAYIVVSLINVTDGAIIDQIIIDSANYDDYLNTYYNLVEATFYNLTSLETYNVTVSFRDANYLVKENSSSFTVGDFTPKGQFQLLQELINKAVSEGKKEFNLTWDVTYDTVLDPIAGFGCMNLTDIPASFTINGLGHKIDALGYCRIFNITSSNITFNNVRFVNGNATGANRFNDTNDNGGAIYWSGDYGSLNNCTFRDNFAVYGGGLYLNASAYNFKISGCLFEDNNASENGGAIDCNSPSMNLTYTVFNSNYAGKFGAALCREANSTGGFGAYNNFTSNYAGIGGAALAWMNSSGINITNYYFESNVAGYSGGAIYVKGNGSDNCQIYNSRFVNNKVDDSQTGHGGAIEWCAFKGLISNSTFEYNSAYDGGALFVGSESEEIIIYNSTFTYNRAYKNGGAINLNASSITINISNFYNNSALEDGGALYVGGNGSANYVVASIFKGNNASGGNGGAINWVSTAGHISYSNFTLNYALYGGALYLGGLSENSTITKSLFESNYAYYNGGAIDSNSPVVNLTHSRFISNYARYGAALCREASATSGFGYNNTFISNHAYISGAALGWMGSQDIKIANYTFINNSAAVSGGAIYVSPTSHNCLINQSTFTGNYVTSTDDTYFVTWTAYNGDECSYYLETENVVGGVGGAVNILAANATVESSNFTNNYAYNGGAIYVGTDNGQTNIISSKFESNHANQKGGSINLNASAVNVNNSRFYNNSALDGGALYVGGAGITNYVSYSVFDKNHAFGDNATIGHGGAIEWVSSEGHILFTNFTENGADYGGGIYFNGKSDNSSIYNSIFKFNNATKNGGAIDWNAKEGKLYNNLFESNYAGEYGAALCRESKATGGSGKNNTFTSNHAGIAGAALAWLDSVGINIDTYYFYDNYADRMGGAIYVGNGSDDCGVKNCIFDNNYVTNETDGYGGAMYYDNDALNGNVYNTNFTNNRATYGGAVFVASLSGNTNINNSIFTSNEAYKRGGAVNLHAASVSVNNSKFNKNIAVDGGALYVKGTDIANYIYHSSFSENKANGGNGGAINWVASEGNIYYSNFTDNTANYGGGIFIDENASDSKISHAIFERNIAIKNGGAIECNASRMNLTHTQFISNVADYGAALCREVGSTSGFGLNNTFIKNDARISGAALAWMNVSSIYINNYTFINNTASVSGGAIYVSDGSDNCTVFNSTFKDNKVITGRGGDIDWIGDCGHIISADFSGSIASNAGSIYVGHNSNMLEIDNSTFTSCRSLGDAGTIAIHGNHAKITNTNFTYSFAYDHGGAIAGFNNDNATIFNCSFKFNVASGNQEVSGVVHGEGGAIYWCNSTNINISECSFLTNEAHFNGGSLSLVNCNESGISNSQFRGDLAVRNGGSISCVDSNDIIIDNVKFDNVAVAFNGGAVYLDNVNNITVNNSEFNNARTSWGTGGAVYVNGNVTIDNSTFTNCMASNNKASSIMFASGNSTLIDSKLSGKNPVFVNKTAIVYLTGNNITNSSIPNHSYDDISAYSVWNDGTLYLENNTFDDYIYNNGTIETQTYTYMLDNKTWYANLNDNFTFWATIKDDHNNLVVSVRTLDSYNNRYPQFQYHYPMPYNTVTLQVYLQGVFIIYGSDPGLKKNKLFTGMIQVKNQPELPLNVTQNNEGEKIVINATLFNLGEDLDGNPYTVDGQTVTFKIGNDTYYRQIVNGIASLELYNVTAGTYIVSATYGGDDTHLSIENSTIFIVSLRDAVLRVDVDNIYYGQTAVAIINTTVSGRVLVYINGKTKFLNVENGTTKVNFTDLEPGNHSVVVVFIGNDYFGPMGNSTVFEVYKLNTTVGVNKTSLIDFGEDEIINVTVNENATGFIKVTINDAEYFMPISNASARFDISGLVPDVYENVTVEYLGDKYFYANSTKISFTVQRAKNYNISIQAGEIKYGENATIIVTLPSLATGNITIWVDDVKYENVSITKGIATLENVSNLGGGSHIVNVTYEGNDYYASNSNATTLNVLANDDWTLNLTVEAHTYGENTTFTVKLPDNACKNVTLTIDTQKYTINLTSGEGNLTVNNISAGLHTATAYYDGDANYTSKSSSAQFVIGRSTPYISIDVNPIYVGQNATINITVSGNATGNVKIYVGNQSFERILNSSHQVQLNVSGLAYGNYDVVVYYDGDENHTSNVNRTNVNVDKHVGEVNIAISGNAPHYVGDSFTITIHNNTDVNVTINGVEYTINATTGIVNITTANLDAGNYTITATIYESDEYLANTTTKTFEIIKHDAKIIRIDVPTSETIIGNNLTVNVTMGNIDNGTLLIEVGNHNYTVEIINKIAKLTVNLPVGNYTAKAYFKGNDNYNGDMLYSSEIFKVVYKRTPIINIDADDVIVIGNSIMFNVTNSTPVNVTVNNVEVTGVGGSYTFTPDATGQYTIVVRSCESEDYIAGYNSTTFMVVRQNASADIIVNPYYHVGEAFNITILNDTSVNVTINGKSYSIVNGIISIAADELVSGHYIIAATTYANDRYNGNVDCEEFDIIKYPSKVNAATDSIDVGQKAIINITAPNYNGFAIIDINGTKYSVVITDGRGQLNITNLANGTYNINITYLENDKYLQSTNHTNLTVSKVIPTIKADAENITMGQNAVFEITLPSDITGTVTVKLNNTNVTAGVTGGVNRIIVSGLSVGVYEANITYNGNYKYLTNFTSLTLKVDPASIKDGITVDDLRNGTVIVHIPGNASGNVTIKIANNTYNATVEDGVAVVNLTNVTPGTYNATVIYHGDGNNTNATLNTTIRVDKYMTPISVEVNDTTVGNITKIIVTVLAHVKNNVTIEIDGEKYNKTAHDGKAIFEIDNLTAGIKSIVAIYYGDDWYLFNATTDKFSVNKLSSAVNATSGLVNVGDIAIINITAPNYNGLAIVKLNNIQYVVALTNGKGQLNVSDLSNGTYDVNVTYLENDKYLSASNTARLTVSKVQSQVNVTFANITFGDNAVFDINVTSDATGNITVQIGKNNYTAGIVSGKAQLIVADLKVGEYDVTVTYNGDKKYLANFTTSKLTVAKSKTTTDDIDIDDLGNGTVIIRVLENATGNVSVVVGNHTYSANITNGSAVITLVNETPGTHNVTIIYSGDGNHTNVSINASITIQKLPSPISIEVNNSFVGDKIKIIVDVLENLTNNVTIEIDGEIYSVKPEKGIAVFDNITLSAGNKTVVATYSGDDSYMFNSTTRQFIVSKKEVSFNVITNGANVGEYALIEIANLPANATGYVIVNVAGTDYGINVTETKSVSVLVTKSGINSVIATYLGDDTYLSNMSATSFIAQKISSNVTIEVENATVGNDVIVKVTLPDNATGNVTITVDGIVEVVNVTSGENIIPISGISEGTHEINVTYGGDDKHQPKTLITNVTVFRSVIAENIKRGWDSPYDYQAQFLGKDGNPLTNIDIQYMVNGKTYIVKTDGEGVAYLSNSHLDVGTYDIYVVNPVTGEQATKKVTIVKRILENKDLTMDFADGSSYVVRIIGDDGNPVGAGEFVSIYANTIYYPCRSDVNGYVRLKINLNPNKYTLRAEYKNTVVKNKLVVKQTLKLVKLTVKVKKGKNLILKAKLKWSNGKPIKGKKIKFTFKGKTYASKTNSKGVAKVTIKSKVTKKLKAGNKYSYSAKYIKNIVKGKVKVK